MEKSLNRNVFLFSSATVTTGGNGAKDTEPEVPASSPSGLRRDPYRGVILVLLLAALVGTAAAIVGGVMTSNAVLFEVAITLGLAAGILTGVVMAQSARARLTASDQPIPQPAPADAEAELAVQSPQKAGAIDFDSPPEAHLHEWPPVVTNSRSARHYPSRHRYSRNDSGLFHLDAEAAGKSP